LIEDAALLLLDALSEFVEDLPRFLSLALLNLAKNRRVYMAGSLDEKGIAVTTYRPWGLSNFAYSTARVQNATFVA